MANPPAPPKKDAQSPDDAFHILRDCRALYLKQLGQLLQEAERVPAAAVQAFQQVVGDYFDEMAASGRRSGFETAKGMTASRISLVGESDLELEIRLGEFSARLMESTGSDLWRVYLRFVTLLKRPDLSTADNPVGPKGVALGLMEFCRQLGEDQDRTLARVDRLESYFSRHLTVLYDSLNEFLAARQVGAAQPSIIGAPNSPNSLAPSAGRTANPVAALQQSLLGPAASFSAGDGGPAAGLLSQAMLDRLLARLDDFERFSKPAIAPSFSATASQPSLEALIPGLFGSPAEEPPSRLLPVKSAQLGIPTGAPEAASIDALALIFETIFASNVLPDAIKASLSQLQIPLLKAAMLDPGFFSAKNHPARQVLDKIARLALGLPADVPADHPLCSRVQAIAAKVRSEFTTDIAVFERQIGELDRLIAERDAAVTRSAEAYWPLLQQVERRSQATRRSRQAIEQRLAPGAPATIAAFLRKHWQNVLVASWLDGGEQGAAWQDNTAVVADLLWSVQPKVDIEERKRLAKMLQPMLQRLNAGMARVGVPDAEQSAFLDTCFALQTAAMRGSPGSMPESADAPPSKPGPSAPAASEFSAGKLRLKIFDQPEAPPNANLLRPPPARTGSWLLVSLGQEAPLCGRLCQGSPDSSLLLIANPDWAFAVAIHQNRLENMLSEGTARVCSNDSLFESAAEKALRQKSGP
ncbi:MAG: DUF1631 family protein [Bacteroidota bacterium]